MKCLKVDGTLIDKHKCCTRKSPCVLILVMETLNMCLHDQNIRNGGNKDSVNVSLIPISGVWGAMVKEWLPKVLQTYI